MAKFKVNDKVRLLIDADTIYTVTEVNEHPPLVVTDMETKEEKARVPKVFYDLENENDKTILTAIAEDRIRY